MTDSPIEHEPQPKPPTDVLLDFVRGTFIGVFSHENAMIQNVLEDRAPLPAGRFYIKDKRTLEGHNCYRIELRPPELDPEAEFDLIPAHSNYRDLTASFLLPIPKTPEGEEALDPKTVAENAELFIIRMRYKDGNRKISHPYYALGTSHDDRVRLWPMAAEEAIDLDAELKLLNASFEENHNDENDGVGDALIDLLEAQFKLKEEFGAETEDELAEGWLQDLQGLNVYPFTKQIGLESGNNHSDAA